MVPVGFAARLFQRIELRMMQQNLLSIMSWLAAAFILFYWIIEAMRLTRQDSWIETETP